MSNTVISSHQEAPLILKGVTKRFGGITAVDGLSLQVKRGQIYGLIGPNGAGKTTAFNCITGIYTPEAGEIIWQGENITGLPADDVVKRGIVRTFQNIRLFSEMSVAENVMAGRHTQSQQHWWHGIIPTPNARKDEQQNWNRVKEVLDFFGLSSDAHTIVSNLSYGQQRRVEMARALAANPKLLILDEPAAGLNDKETIQLREQISNIRDLGITILLIEHDMDMVMNISDYLTVLNFGKPIAHGTPKEIQANPEVIEAYLGSDDDD